MFKKILFCIITGAFILAFSVLPAFAYSPPPQNVNEDISAGLTYYQASGLALYETVDEQTDMNYVPIQKVVYLGDVLVYPNTQSESGFIENAYLSFSGQYYYSTNPDGTITTARYLEVTDSSNNVIMYYNPATSLFVFTSTPNITADVVYFAYSPEIAYVSRPDIAIYLGFIDYSYMYDYGFEDGYRYGHQDGYEAGEEDAYDIGYDEGYQSGYSAGQLSSYDGFTIKDLMNAVVSAPVNMVRSMLNVEVLGFNLSGIFFGLITLSILVTVVVLIFKVAR